MQISKSLFPISGLSLRGRASFLPHMAAHIFLGNLHMRPHGLDSRGSIPAFQRVQDDLVLLKSLCFALYRVHNRLCTQEPE